MIRAFHALSTLLFFSAVGFLLLNLLWQFAANGKIKALTIEDMWISISKPGFESARAFIEPNISSNVWTLVTHDAPAAVVLAAIAGILYLPVAILMLLGFGKK